MFDFSNSDLLSTLGSIAVLGGMLWLLQSQWEKIRSSNVAAQDYINRNIVKNHAGFLLGLAILIYTAEAIFAAVLPDAHGHMNFPARMAMHMTVALGGMLGNVTLPTTLTMLIERGQFLFDDKQIMDYRRWFIFIGTATLAFMSMVMAIALPFYNYITIAIGLDSYNVAYVAFMELLSYPAWWLDMNAIRVEHGFTANVKILSQMSYYMIACYSLVIVHYIITLSDGIYAMVQHYLDQLSGSFSRGGRT